MNKEQNGILFGMTIGDGCLYIQNGYPSIIIGHSPKQKEYIEYKSKLLENIFGTKVNITEYVGFNKSVQKTYTNLRITKGHKYFSEMYEIFYSNKKKIYSKEILDTLTDQGLAIWYMDDGSGAICKNKLGTPCGAMTRISTYCSREESVIIKDWFKDRYDIEIKFDIDKRNDKYSIRMNKESSIRFVQIVEPYIIPSMEYKIQHVKLY